MSIRKTKKREERWERREARRHDKQQSMQNKARHTQTHKSSQRSSMYVLVNFIKPIDKWAECAACRCAFEQAAFRAPWLCCTAAGAYA